MMSRLHLTFYDMTAAAVLLICLTGHNLSTLSKATVRHLRPDGHSGRPASAMVDLVKPRRGSRSAHMSVALPDITPGGQRPADQLATPFGVYTLLIELGQATRVQAGTDRLLTCYWHRVGKGGRRFRIGLPHLAIFQWSRTRRANLFCDPPPDNDATIGPPLHLDSRRLRITFLELHQRPGGRGAQGSRDQRPHVVDDGARLPGAGRDAAGDRIGRGQVTHHVPRSARPPAQRPVPPADQR
jgi:hypothetical protein